MVRPGSIGKRSGEDRTNPSAGSLDFPSAKNSGHAPAILPAESPQVPKEAWTTGFGHVGNNSASHSAKRFRRMPREGNAVATRKRPASRQEYRGSWPQRGGEALRRRH
jgi:hypothetical protein